MLRPGGFALITLPDLQRVAEYVAQGDSEEALLSCNGKPLTAIDIIYGWGYYLAQGNYYMAHKTGFTSKTLTRYLQNAGFRMVDVTQGDIIDLWATAYK